ncbi:MAG: methyltransferase [Candidatus Paceibacterota bacterium]|jgi:protein-S-isoprenylcysteine O-methyltransferase Ste14
MENYIPRGSIHKVLAHSYSVYFTFFLGGIFLDLIFNFKVSSSPLMVPVGVFFLISGSLLVFWAQKTSRNLNKENLTKENFYRGPYKYTRGPTHWGLFLLMLGFGLIMNTFFVILFSFISFVFAKYTFLNKQEKLLEAKYGVPYREYKKIVKF